MHFRRALSGVSEPCHRSARATLLGLLGAMLVNLASGQDGQGGGQCEVLVSGVDAASCSSWDATTCCAHDVGAGGTCDDCETLGINFDLSTLPADFCSSGCGSLTSLQLTGQFTAVPADFCSGCGSLTSLELTGQFTAVPADFCSGCDSLAVLNLAGAQSLTSLPAGFCGECSSLATVHVSRPLSLPDDLLARGVVRMCDTSGCSSGDSATCCAGGTCDGCTTLDLANIQLPTLPADFCSGCSSLTHLQGNRWLTTLPANFCSGCGSLLELRLGRAPLTSLPVNFCSGCSSLKVLDLSSTQLTTLPADFCSWCSSLTWLSLSGAPLTTLPADFCSECSSLETLGLSSTQLTTLPADFCSECSSLETLNLEYTQLTIKTCSCDMLMNSSIPWTSIRDAVDVSLDDACSSGCPLQPGNACIPGMYTDLLLGECVPCPNSVGQYLAGCALVLLCAVLLVQLYRKTGESALMAGSASNATVKKHGKFQNAVETVDSGIHRAKRREFGRSLLQINASHLQITTWTWTCDWEWPPFVRMLSHAIGSFIQIDINATARPECSAIPRNFVSAVSACSLMVVILLMFFCLQSKYNCAGECKGAAPAQQRAHIVSFSVALYTLTFPLLVSQAVAWLDWEGRSGDDYWRNNEVPNVNRAKTSEMIIAIGLAAAWLAMLTMLVPRRIFVALRRHHKDNELHSNDVRSRLGWVYEKYVDKFYWHELALLELRFLTILCGKLLSTHAVASQCLLMIILMVGLALQLRNKPYAESVAEGLHWSSINRQAAVADGCKVAAVACGLLSTVTNGAEGGTLAHLISAGAVLSAATPVLLAGATKWREKHILEVTSATTIEVKGHSETGEPEPQRLVEQIEERIDTLTATFQAELEKLKRELAHAKDAAHMAEAESNGGHGDETNAPPTPTTSGDAEMGMHAQLVAQARSERTQKLAEIDTEPDTSRRPETGECVATP